MHGVHDVLDLSRLGHPNLLLVGPDSVTDPIIDLLEPCLAMPLHRCDLPGPLTLPAAHVGTLLLRNVDALGSEEQQQLFRWLNNNHGDAQVVSVSSTPLYSHVQRGTFDEGLYYRLNTVLEDVEASALLNTLQ